MIKEAMLLTGLCYLDLVSSIAFINLGLAEETGPVMAGYFLNWGIPGLIGGKVVIVALGVFVIEAAWRSGAISRKKAAAFYLYASLAFLTVYAALITQQHRLLF